MLLKGIDAAKVSKLLSQHVDTVSCLQCCKYFVIPERAPCGHSLCHTCWRGRKVCPVCASAVDRRLLRPDTSLQALATNVRDLVEAYELLFGLKMDDFAIDPPVKIIKEVDPSEHVKEWLTNSNNHFSAPPYSDTQQSTQDILPPVTLSTSKIQVHVESNRSLSPKRVTHVATPQDDWDKIEVIPDTEDVTHKNKENIVGPMDFEPFVFDDNEYSNEHPRRSSRRKDNKSDKTPASPNKVDNNLNTVVDKLDKAKQNWTNVKKMKKEFSKLNKINKNKLNVSIEMCKKTQSVKSKQNSNTPPNLDVEEIVIEDNTPNVLIDKSKKNVAVSNGKDNNAGIDKDEIHCSTSILEKNFEARKNNNKSNKVCLDNIPCPEVSHEQDKNYIQDTVCMPENINKTAVEPTEDAPNVNVTVSKSVKESTIKIPFIKRSRLQNNIPDKPHVEPSDLPASNPDDIHITIRVGDVVTNITINKKHNDVQLKVNTDREVQTSLSPCPAPKPVINPEPVQYKDQNVQTTQVLEVPEIQIATQKLFPKKPLLDKTVSTKKQTASAETTTANFEITESVEKELSKIMECEDETESSKVDEIPNTVINAQTTAAVQNETQEIANTKLVIESNVARKPASIVSDVPNTGEFDEMDIFNSGSVKEQQVTALKDCRTQSEIIPTFKTLKIYKTQKLSEKRKRDDEKEDLLSKRQKADTPNKDIVEGKLNETESPNYDDVMGDLFAKIDVEMEEIKSQKIKSTLKKTPISENTNTVINKDAKSQNKTQELNIETQSGKTQVIDKNVGEKFSENMFSTVGNVLEKGILVPGLETQQNIDNLLTPGMCLDVASSNRPEEVVVLCTPLDDDSDKSVVEETPQKNKSPPKSKQRSDSSNQSSSKLPLAKPSKTVENNTPNTSDVINLTDTVRESRDTKVTSLTRKDTLETPITINRFVDEIKHNSTPFARKSLNFTKNDTVDGDETLRPSDKSDIAKTTQEKRFMAEAFENAPNTPVRRPLMAKNVEEESVKYVIAGSCLTSTQLTNLKILCFKRKWIFADKFTPDLTHLVVSVDEEGKAQRSVKYMCALASSKWIVSYRWVEKCLESNTISNEERYEALDSTGDCGPHRSRVAKRKIFEGYTFYCMPPFSVLDHASLTSMLRAAGGHVVTEPSHVRVTGSSPSLLLAEPAHTQEDRFIYLAMELNIVPVNFEWALNCLGSYSINSLHNLLLCPVSLLPRACSTWPEELLAYDE